MKLTVLMLMTLRFLPHLVGIYVVSNGSFYDAMILILYLNINNVNEI